MTGKSCPDKASGAGNQTYATAIAVVRAGLSIIPIRRDGSKAPDGKLLPSGKWEPFQERLPTEDELREWFDRPDPRGIALIGGGVSGGLEQIDFDKDAATTFPEWSALVEAERPGLVARLNITRTPRRPAGYHVRYRCVEVPIPGNGKLAIDPAAKGKDRCLIETRGTGGYALAPGSPGCCHETGNTYDHHSGPPLAELPTITAAERETLIRCARLFTRAVPEEAATPKQRQARPGDDFNSRATWREILEPHGWREVGQSGQKTLWKRPGKDGSGWSATTGYCSNQQSGDLFANFSENAHPFQGAQGGKTCSVYSKFTAYTLLNHNGDFTAAAKQLATEGYGEPPERADDPKATGGSDGDSVPAQPAAPRPEPSIPEPSPWPEPPCEQAFYGLAGEITRMIEPQTEADPIAVLAQILVMFGSAIGRTGHWLVENDRHHGNLFCCLVGPTGVGRKGTSKGRALQAFSALDDDWQARRILGGLSSGEGLIKEVRDERREKQPVKEKGRVIDYQEVIADEGVADKRLLVIEPEFGRVLKVMTREGNVLSAILRQAWETGNLATMTKNGMRATDAHLSIIAHITRTELRHLLSQIDAENGLANRFLWLAVRRSKLLPFGGEPIDLGPKAHKLALAVEAARLAGEVPLGPDAADLWGKGGVYRELEADAPGLLGAVTNRASAQVRRLAMLYALLDFGPVVNQAHLLAAMALWDYCERSCRWVFGDSTGDGIADDILASLRAALDKGMSQTEIVNLFGRHIDSQRLKAAVTLLQEQGLVRSEPVATGGRTSTRWYARDAKKAS